MPGFCIFDRSVYTPRDRHDVQFNYHIFYFEDIYLYLETVWENSIKTNINTGYSWSKYWYTIKYGIICPIEKNESYYSLFGVKNNLKMISLFDIYMCAFAWSSVVFCSVYWTVQLYVSNTRFKYTANAVLLGLIIYSCLHIFIRYWYYNHILPSLGYYDQLFMKAVVYF